MTKLFHTSVSDLSSPLGASRMEASRAARGVYFPITSAAWNAGKVSGRVGLTQNNQTHSAHPHIQTPPHKSHIPHSLAFSSHHTRQPSHPHSHQRQFLRESRSMGTG